MLAIISPAKTLDFTTPWQTAFSQPCLTAHSAELMAVCQQLAPAQIASLMKISDKLASLNAARFAEWQAIHTPENAKPALLAFKGDVYTGLAAESLSHETLSFAQSHLAILSGLYGLLKPLDLIQPYRLEMGTKLNNPRGKNLYDFWGHLITEQLQQRLDEQGDNVLINLASDEYFSAVKPQYLHARIIKPIFLDEKNGQFKIISFHAKKARGMMSRFLLENQFSHPEALKAFDLGGYSFDESRSSENEWVFKRPEGK